MTCPLQEENAELLLAYCSRKLDWELTQLLDRHIEHCPACHAMAESQRVVWEALDAWEVMPVSRDFNRRLYRRIEDESSSRSWARLVPAGFRFRPAVGLAAACAMVFVAFLVRGPEYHDDNSSPASVEVQDIEQAERALEDLEMLKQLGPLAMSESAAQGRTL